MIAVILAILSCIASNLLIRYASERYTYNVSFILLMIECVKLLICACVTRYINREQSFKVRWGFIVNAGLYSVVNLLTYQITSMIEPSIYSVLIQHKLIWVVVFSLILLKKSFSVQQYISLVVVCFGCILVKMSNIEGDISVSAIFLIVLQGICSSLSSVWIEKMMKVEDRHQVSEDESKQKLYWFLSDSFQMYMFGIPIYLFGSFSDREAIDIPMKLGFALVAVGVLQGLTLGAVFVYHSSVVRSLVAAMVIVILAAEHRVYSIEIVSGIGLVVLGVIGWVYKKN
jgi:drug/metabolite transporter (DMT)-like permease